MQRSLWHQDMTQVTDFHSQAAGLGNRLGSKVFVSADEGRVKSKAGWGKWLLLVGVLGMMGTTGGLMWDGYQAYRQAQVANQRVVLERAEMMPNVVNKVPKQIIIKSLSIDLKVVPGTVQDGEWEVSETKANYLVGSGGVGDRGNVVIYAHKRPELFEDLIAAAAGDMVTVEAEDVVADYEILSKRVVSPDEVSVLESNPRLSELTLYTCNGWEDEERLVVKARLVRKFKNGFAGILAGSTVESQ
jgi:LPXTG-site transpeptidase (sortase) family protein